MGSHRAKHNSEANCEYCGKHFTYYKAPSEKEKFSCGLECSCKSNKHRKQTPVGVCPICGVEFKMNTVAGGSRRKACSRSCSQKLRWVDDYETMHSNITSNHNYTKKVWTKDVERFLAENYPKAGSAFCANALGLTRNAIMRHAQLLGLRVTEDTKKILYKANSNIMRNNPPMRNPETARKVADANRKAWKTKKRRKAGLIELSKQQMNKHSKLQARFKMHLEEKHMYPFEEYIIKDRFVVDFAFVSEKLIVEIDGCYWHGHKCRFETLTERQLKQKNKDIARNKYLEKCGWTVVRIWECHINHSLDECLDKISKHLTNSVNRL